MRRRHELVETTIGESARQRITRDAAAAAQLPADIYDDPSPAVACVYCEGVWLEEQRSTVEAELECPVLRELDG